VAALNKRDAADSAEMGRERKGEGEEKEDFYINANRSRMKDVGAIGADRPDFGESIADDALAILRRGLRNELQTRQLMYVIASVV